MASPYLKRLSKETGVSIDKLEPHWSQAKELATEHFGKLETDFGEKEWKWAMQMVKQLAGIRENRISIQDFIATDKSVDEFITESMAVTSGDFPSLQTNVISKDDEEDEEDEFDEPVREEENLQEAGEETGPYINSPKRVQIMQQWVEEGDKLMINAHYEDIDGRYKIEVRIPYTNKTQWAVFTSKEEAKRYGFLPDNV